MKKHAVLVGCIVVALAGLFVAGTLASRAPGDATPDTSDVSDKTAAELYTKHCASCHGKDGQAKTFKAKLNHARNLTDAEWQEKVSDERIFNSITNGKGKMPAFGKKLTEQEINLLVAYVRSLRK
jgi:mono/diheme cytochrome c family protein